jgi:aminoglycoside phosphotransferase (APT) family kinase protein
MTTGTPPADIHVSEQLIRALLADQHPQHARLPLSFSGEGWDNFTWRLGDDFAVRLPRRKIAISLLLNEQRCLPLFAARLPLPAPLPVAIGAPIEAFPYPWHVIPWIEGEPADFAPPDATQGPALAAFLRALHRPCGDSAPANPSRGIPLIQREPRLSECLARIRSYSDIVTPATELCWREAIAAPVTQERVWLHGDLHAQNALTLKGKLSGIIDWGDVCGGDPAVDLAAFWGLLPDSNSRKAAIAAYAPDEALLARAKGWAIVFGATLYDNGRINEPRHMRIGELTLRRLAEDL